MVKTLWLVFAMMLVFPLSAETWKRAVVVDDAEISVYVVTEQRLKSLRGGADLRRLVRGTDEGYTVLGKIGNRNVCYIYVTKNRTDATLAHERRHCAGWIH